jgi:hypothetical protein
VAIAAVPEVEVGPEAGTAVVAVAVAVV